MEIDSALANRARSGALLTAAELLELEGADVLSLGMLADEVRRARVGDGVSYTRVLDIAAEGLPPGPAGDALIESSGEVRLSRLPASLDEAVAAIGALRPRVGSPRRLTGFDLDDLCARGWGSMADVLRRVRSAGLDAIAEARVDGAAREQVATVLAAGLAIDRFSVRRWPGDASVDLLLRARALFESYPATRVFAPLAREQPVATPTTGYQDVKLVALARLALPTVRVIEVDWQQYGPKLAQVALMFGANHLDRVAASEDPALGRRRATAEEVRRNIVAAGFRPLEPGEAA